MSKYLLQGMSSGSCGCRASVSCACWGDSAPSPQASCCDSFVAFHIQQGAIASLDVSGLSVVRLIREQTGNAPQTILYLDATTSLEQRLRLAEAFCGKHGGVLAQIAQLYAETSVKVAPITYQLSGNRATIKLGSIVVKELAPQTPFLYQV